MKKKLTKEMSIFFLPNILRLFVTAIKIGRLRGNVSVYFPAAVNLIKEGKAILI